MARQFLTPINLNKNELQNSVLQNLASAPSSPVKGQQYLSTSTNKPTWYNGSSWITPYFASDASTSGTANTLALRDSNGDLYGVNIYGTTSVWAGSSGFNSSFGGVDVGNSIGSKYGGLSLNYTGTGNQGIYIFNGDGGVAQTGSLFIYPNVVGSGNPYVSTTLYGRTGGYIISHNDTVSALATPSSSFSMGGQKITNLADPTSPQDAATKNYVDNAVVGIDWKASVRVATTTAGTLASSFANGSVVDGVTLATGNRILIKDQASGSENGIYVVAASGAPTRATDADTGAELTSSLAVFVEEGTTNADSGWTLTNNGTIVIGSSVLTFTQFTGLGSVTAGAGLTKSGNTIDVVGTANRITANADSIDIASTYVGQTSITTLGTITTGTWTGTSIAIANGGTGATTAAAARTNLGTPGKYTATNGAITVSGGQATWTITAATHGLGAIGSIIVQFKEVSSGAVMEVDIVVNDSTGDITLTWASASNVTSGTYRVTAIG